MEFIIEVRTGWGEESKYLVRGCASEAEAKEKLADYFKTNISIDLSLERPASPSAGYYISATDKIDEKKEVVEVCNFTHDDVM